MKREKTGCEEDNGAAAKWAHEGPPTAKYRRRSLLPQNTWLHWWRTLWKEPSKIPLWRTLQEPPPLPPCCCSVAVVLLLLSAAVIPLLLFCHCLYCQERRRCKKILPPHRSKRSSRTTDDNSTVKNDDGMVFFVRDRSIDDGGVKRTHQNGPAVSRVIRLSQKPHNYEDGRLTKAPIFCTTAITRRW